MSDRKGEIRVGKKDKDKYLQACFYSIENFGVAHIRGLGSRFNKVTAIVQELEEINGIEIVSKNSISVDGKTGLEVVVKKRGGEKMPGKIVLRWKPRVDRDLDPFGDCRLDVCAWCGRDISGDPLIYEGETWHIQCFGKYLEELEK